MYIPYSIYTHVCICNVYIQMYANRYIQIDVYISISELNFFKLLLIIFGQVLGRLFEGLVLVKGCQVKESGV